jgi:hypothetical protein
LEEQEERMDRNSQETGQRTRQELQSTLTFQKRSLTLSILFSRVLLNQSTGRGGHAPKDWDGNAKDSKQPSPACTSLHKIF